MIRIYTISNSLSLFKINKTTKSISQQKFRRIVLKMSKYILTYLTHHFYLIKIKRFTESSINLKYLLAFE